MEGTNNDRAELIRQAKKQRIARYIEKELRDTVATEDQLVKESNQQVDELSPQFFTKTVSPRMQEIHRYYEKRIFTYSLAGTMLLCGAAAAFAPWGLPFVIAGASVAAGGGVLAVGARVLRDDDFNVSLDIETARMAARQNAYQNSIERDIDLVAIGEKKGADVEYIRQRAEKKLERLENATIKAYNRAKRRLEKFDRKQVSFQKNAVSGRASMWSSMLGLKRWANRDEKNRARLDNDMYLNIAELIKINNSRSKLGLPLSTQADKIVKKHEAQVIESAERTAKQRFDQAERNAAQNQKTLEEHKTVNERQQQAFADEFAKRLHKSNFTDIQVAQFLAPPCSISYPKAFEVLMKENFGTTEAVVDFEIKQQYPIFPKVLDWETGEVEIKDEKVVLTTYQQIPRYGYAPLCLTMTEKDVEKLYAPYDYDAKKYYQKLHTDDQDVEIYIDTNKIFVVRQPTFDEIRSQKVNGVRMEIKPQFLHPIERDKEGVPQFNTVDGTLKYKDEYLMADIKPSKSDVAWPEVATKDGKLVRERYFDGTLDSYKKKSGKCYSVTEVSKAENRKKAELVGIILRNASENEIKQINKIFNGLPEEQKQLLRSDDKFAKVAVKYRKSHEGIYENIGVYDSFCKNVAAEKYEAQIEKNTKDFVSTKDS